MASARLSGVLPDGVCLGADLSVVGSGQEVSTRTEVVADRAERSQEALGMLGGFEALRHPFPLPRRKCEFSARLFNRLCRRCSACGSTCRMAAG